MTFCILATVVTENTRGFADATVTNKTVIVIIYKELSNSQDD